MDLDAKAYNTLSKPQYDIGCAFLRSLNVSKGDRVLDIGCGTGDLTKFIADMVGSAGEVVGVDPDEARIKIAQEKFKDVENLKFFVGDSTIEFPHDNEGYYDLHFSSSVFHWLKGNNKKIYLEKAQQCLKPGGRVAIQTVVKQDIDFDPNIIERLTELEYKKLVEEAGPFTNVTTEMVCSVSHFASFGEFDAWLKASSHCNTQEMDPEWMKEFLAKCTRTEPDGRVTLEVKDLVRITGTKN